MLQIIEVRKAAVNDSLVNHISNYVNNTFPKKELHSFDVLTDADYVEPQKMMERALSVEWQRVVMPVCQVTTLQDEFPDDKLITNLPPMRVHLIKDADGNQMMILFIYSLDEEPKVTDIYIGYNSVILFGAELLSKLRLTTSDWRFAI